MDIIFDDPIWQLPENTAVSDMKTSFSPVDAIRLWLRDENTAGSHGHAAVHEFYCLYICLEGSGCIEIDGVPYHIKKNEALGVLPRHPHIRLKGTEKVRYLLIRFLCPEYDFVRRIFSGILCLDDALVPPVETLVRAYEKAAADPTEANQNEVGLFLAFLLNKLNGCQKKPLAKSVPDKRIQEVLQLIVAPENLNLSMRDIARKLGVTPGHLSDLLHDSLGYPPRDVRRSVRHQVACNYLLYSALSVSEIAERTGFKSVYAFSRFFKNITGKSPMAYRRSNGNVQQK